jgi:hypothetical protein
MLSIDGPPGAAGQGTDRLDETAATLCREIRALMAKGDRAGEEFYKAAGRQIGELKRLHPDHWLVMVREECGLSRTRAFQLVAIAEGRRTVTDARARNAEANRRLRARRASRDGLTLPGSTSAEVGAFLRQLGTDRFFEALRHAPELRSEIEQRVLTLHERKATPETAVAAAMTRARLDTSILPRALSLGAETATKH